MANGQPLIARIATTDLSVELQAETSGPRLSGFGFPGATAWKNEAREELISFAEINGEWHKLVWRLNRAASSAKSSQVNLVYDCAEPRLRLLWSWEARAKYGPIEHTVRIENRDSKEVWIPLQNSFTFVVPQSPETKLKHFFIDKGAGKPSPVGTHEVDMDVGYRWDGTSSTYAQLFADEPREVIPWFAIQTQMDTGWYVGIEFSGRTHLFFERTAQDVRVVVGLNGEPGSSFRTRIEPGGFFVTPTVFLGAYQNGLDGMGNLLRPWVRGVLGNRAAWADKSYPLVVNNSWGSGMQVDEALARKMIRDSAELGIEMFHVDAGWFRGVGDWYPSPQKFPHGLATVADDAHKHGLKFGIWVDWTQAGVDTEPGALNVHDPRVRDWTVSDVANDWRPQEFKGQTVDLGVPAVREYAQRELNRLVKNYHLDMLEHDGYLVAQGCVRTDHPHAPPDPRHLRILVRDGNHAVESSNSTDVSYHATRAYYEIYETLRREYPGLLLEICNDGGRMVDFGSAAHGDYFSITDSYDPLSNRQAVYDTSHLLPPAMLETYVEKWPTPTIENFRYMLRSGMMGWLTLMLDTTKWSTAQHAAAKSEIELYKTQLRPLIRDAALYHAAPRPDGVHWDGIEYFDSLRGKGALFAFRGSAPELNKHIFRLQGVRAATNYRLHFQDGSNPDRTIRGSELLEAGLTVSLPIANSSEIVLFEETR